MADSVTVLLEKADEGVEEIRGRYEANLLAQQVSGELLYAVRNVVQDVQSALDWTATAVKHMYYPGSKWRPYYPLTKDPARFAGEMEKQIKGLAADHPTIAAAFERHQPYQPEQTTLGYLHALAKVNKHQDFTPQIRTERQAIRQAYTGAIVENDDQGKVRIGPTDGSTNTILDGTPPLRTQRLIYVDWRFADPPVSVLSTLEDLVRLARAAVEDIRREAKL